MNKFEMNKTRLCVQYDDHPKLMCTVLCSLLEHQSFVDLAIRCGNNTVHAHKCILAACSPFFREKLKLNPDAEQVIINGIDFSTLKSVMEFIYCGETCVLEENLKYVVAAARLFQIRGLQALSSEVPGNSSGNPEELYIPPPIFMNKKPTYAYQWHLPQNAPELLVDETRNGSTSQNPGVTAGYHSITEGTTYTTQLDALPMQMVNIENVVIDSESMIIPLDFHGGTDNHEVLSAIPLDAIDPSVPIAAAAVTVTPNSTPALEEDDILNEINTNGLYENVMIPKIMAVHITHLEQEDSEAILENDMLMHSRFGIGKHHQHQMGVADETGYQLDVVADEIV